MSINKLLSYYVVKNDLFLSLSLYDWNVAMLNIVSDTPVY